MFYFKRRSTIKPYEIIPANGGRDLGSGASKGGAGQRVWNVLDF